MPSKESSTNHKHDAFISYSRKNESFAGKLEDALEKYKPPKGLDLPQRYLNVFRDNADFTAGEYHQRLERHLQTSAKLIVICSPEARASHFVNDEIRRFANIAGVDNIIPVLFRGIPNNEAKKDQEDEMAFPPALCELMEMPLAVNYLGFDPKNDKVNKGAFVDSWHMLLSNVYDVSRGEIEQREKKRRQRARRTAYSLLTGSIAVLSVLLIFALVSRSQAIDARQYAEEQRNQAIANAAEARRQKETAENAQAEEQKQRKRAEQQTQVANEQRDIAQQQTRIAEERRREAERQQQIALAGSVSARSEVVRNQGAIPSEIREYQFGSTVNAWPDLLQRGLLLSVEGAKRIHKATGAYSLESTQALLSGLSLFPRTEMRFDLADEVEAAIFSPNGNYLVAGENDKKVRIWSIRARALVSEFEAEIDNANFSENSEYLAITTEHGELIVRNLNNNSELWRKTQESEFKLYTFSRNGKYLVTSTNKRAVVWETATGKQISSIDHPDVVTSAMFNLDGSALATACDEHPVQISNTLTGTKLNEIKGGENALAIAFSPDGRLIATGQRNTADIWDARTGENVKHIAGIPPFDDEYEYIVHVAFSTDGKQLATVGDDGTTQLWDVETGNLKWVVGEAYNAILSPDNRHILIQQRGAVEAWDIITGKEVARLLYKEDGKLIAFNANNALFAVADDKSMALLNASPNQDVERITYRGNRMQPTRSGPYVGIKDQELVTVWDSERPREVARFVHDQPVNNIVFSDDGKYGATTSDDGNVRIWEVFSSREVARMGGVPAATVSVDSEGEKSEIVNVKYIFFSPQRRYLVLVGRDKTTRLWSVPEGRPITMINSEVEIEDLRFTSDESYIAAVIPGREIVLMETASGRRMNLPEKEAAAIAFTTDGRFFAAGTGDVVKIYQVKTGQEAARVVVSRNGSASNNAVKDLEFSADGKLLALGSKTTRRKCGGLRITSN